MGVVSSPLTSILWAAGDVTITPGTRSLIPGTGHEAFYCQASQGPIKKYLAFLSSEDLHIALHTVDLNREDRQVSQYGPRWTAYLLAPSMSSCMSRYVILCVRSLLYPLITVFIGGTRGSLSGPRTTLALGPSRLLCEICNVSTEIHDMFDVQVLM